MGAGRGWATSWQGTQGTVSLLLRVEIMVTEASGPQGIKWGLYEEKQIPALDKPGSLFWAFWA